MTHDPWSLHASLSCPACHVTGKVVTCVLDDSFGEDSPFTCVDCGQTWVDTGVLGDVKDCRVAYGRLIEGRPYEAPKPVGTAKPGPTMEAINDMYKSVYIKVTGTSAFPVGVVAAPPFASLKKATDADGYTNTTPVRIVADPRCPPDTVFIISSVETLPSGEATKVNAAMVKGIGTDKYTFHGPYPVSWPFAQSVPTGETDGVTTVTTVDRESGTITVEYTKK